jgi:hypothetical protein
LTNYTAKSKAKLPGKTLPKSQFLRRQKLNHLWISDITKYRFSLNKNLPSKRKNGANKIQFKIRFIKKYESKKNDNNLWWEKQLKSFSIFSRDFSG